MALLTLERVNVGQVGVKPGSLKMVSTDNLATITAAGYLNDNGNQLVVNQLSNSDVIECLYSYSKATDNGTFTFLRVSVSAGVVTLSVSAGDDALTSAHIFVGNASNVATDVAMSGDIAISNTGVTSIASGVIVNADVNASAAIAYSKLAALPSAQLLVGSAANVATAVAVTGDVTISNAGVTAIAADSIVNADVKSDAAIAYSKLAALTSAHLLVGSAGNVATDVAMSGDVALANTGATTLGAVVNAAKAATYAPEAVIAGMPVLHVFNMAAGATATRTIATAQNITVVDAWAVLRGAGTAADTVQLKNNAGTAMTNALDCNVADTSVVRAGQIDDAANVVAAGGNLQCTVTDGGGGDVPAIDVYALCYVNV